MYQSTIVNALTQTPGKIDLFNIEDLPLDLTNHLTKVVYQAIGERYADFDPQDNNDIRRNVAYFDAGYDEDILEQNAYTQEQIIAARNSELTKLLTQAYRYIDGLIDIIDQQRFSELDAHCVEFENFLHQEVTIPKEQFEFAMRQFQTQAIRELQSDHAEIQQEFLEDPELSLEDAEMLADLAYGSVAVPEKKGEIKQFDPSKKRPR